MQQERIETTASITEWEGDEEHLKESLIFANCGTPGYLAPEIFQESKSVEDVSAKSDMFAMGVVFYMMITKKPLYLGADWKEVLRKNRDNDYEVEEHFKNDQ